MLTLGTGIGGGLIVDGRLVHGARGAAGELGHIVVDADGPPCPGSCPNHGCLEALVSGHALGAEGLRLARQAPNSALGLRAGLRARDHRPAGHRAGPRRRPRGLRRDDAHRPAARPRGRRRWSTSSTPRSSSSAAARSPPASCCWPRRARSSRAARCRSTASDVRLVPARFGAESGMLGAACWPSTWRAWPSHERAAHRLPDADRQPRGRHAARARRRCARPTSSPARTRAPRRCCSTATACRPSACATTSTTSGAWRRELVERMRAGAVVALVSDAGMPLVSDPGLVLVQACVAAGLAVEVLPGPSAALAALVAQRWRPPTLALRAASCRARRARWQAVLRSPEAVVAFESPRRVAASLAVLAEVDPERPVAVCRELTKVHEEVVRGSASELAARYAERGAARRDRARRRRRAGRRGPARAGAGRAAAAGRRGRGAGAAGGRRGRRAHRDERERAVSRADRHEVAQGLQQVTRGRPRRAIAAVCSAHGPTPSPRRPRLARARVRVRHGAGPATRRGGRRLALAAARAGGRRLSPVAMGAVRARAAPGHRRVGFARRRRACRLRGARQLRRPRAASRAGGERALWRAGGHLPRAGPAGGARGVAPRRRAGAGHARPGGTPAARRAARRRPSRLPRPAHPAGRRPPGAAAPRSGAACAAPASRGPAPGVVAARVRRPHRPSRSAACRGRPTPRWRSWPPRCPSAAWCAAAVAAATRSRIGREPPPTHRRRPADAL